MTSETAEGALRRYYDALSRRLLTRRLFGAGEGAERLTMHRALVDPAAPAAGPDPLTLERILDDALPWPAFGPEFAGLDAGCGYGGVSLRLAERRGGRWTGVTLSPVQAAEARRAARRRGLSERVRHLVRSYDDGFPRAERFDVAIAIESLIHSADKRASVGNIAGVLTPGGRLAVIDDVAIAPPPLPDRLDAAMAAFQEGWMAPDVPHLDGWRAIFASAGLILERIQDLTPLARPRAEPELAALERRARARLRRSWLRRRRAVIAGEIGGLALERLYNAGAMRYLLLVARKG